jgi:signal transduction histidine kinase
MRKYTTSLLEMMDDGVMDAKTVAEMCLAYMSEDEVEDMMRVNDLLEDYNEDDEEYDGQPDEAQEWESFDPDC